MFHPTHDFFRALSLANKAMRRGNVAETERWIRCAERHMAIAERLQSLAARQAGERRPAEKARRPGDGSPYA